MKTFNVLHYNFNLKKVEPYNVLIYFRDCWKDKCYKDSVSKIKKELSGHKRQQLFKDWIISRSRYMYWARCEYEFLIASWPFGSYQFKQEIKDFLKQNPQLNLDNHNSLLNFENIITQDMQKIDIHEQIMMNIDIIVDILYTEFKLDKICKNSTSV